MYLLFVTGMFFLADSGYSSPIATPRILTINSLFTQLAAPCIIPLLIIYLKKIGNNSSLKHIHLIWILVPIILFTGELTMVLLYNIDNIEHFVSDMYTYGIDIANQNSGYMYRLYYLWAVVGFRIVMAIEILFLFLHFAMLLKHRGLPLRYLPAFLYHKGNIKVLGLSCGILYAVLFLALLKLAMPRPFLLSHQWIPLVISSLLTVLLFFLFYIGLYSDRNTVTLEEMKRGLINLDEVSGSGQTNGAAKGSSHISKIIASSAFNNEGNSLHARFNRIVIEQQMFLQPQLTIMDVADRLGTNKTYVSKLVNNTYHMPFPDLINALRVEYTQRYLINHRTATQAEVAQACGYTSASALNNTFKKVTGMTPKIWLAIHDQEQN